MQVKLLLKHLKPGAKILEIGCGQGLLLNELKKNGFNATGIEPSKSAAQKAMEKGLDVKTGYFPDCLLPSQQFDAFIMSHVLEHIKNPEKIIYEIKKIAPNGILMLIQSNWRGLIPKIYKSRWYAWVPEHHYWHFTPKGLEIYLKKFNIKKLDLEFSSLVHPKNTIFFLANFIPKERDQFHILFKIN